MTTNSGHAPIPAGTPAVDSDHLHLMIQAEAIPVPEAHRPLRLLVTGGRHYSDRQAVVAVLLGVAQTHGGILHVMDGQCPAGGLDDLAHDFAVEMGWPTKRMPAKWRQYRRAAGRIRNQEMVDAHPDLCIGWPDPNSSGTWDCLDKAARAGIPSFYVIHEDRWAIHRYRAREAMAA